MTEEQIRELGAILSDRMTIIVELKVPDEDAFWANLREFSSREEALAYGDLTTGCEPLPEVVK